jgi:hypothetical protein
MLRCGLIAGLMVVVGSALAAAQEFPKPGPEHKQLAEMVGTWDAVMDMNGQKSKATAVYRSICDGMWLESDFQGSLGETKFQGRGLDGYDPVKKQYVGVWVDSLTAVPMHMAGNYDDAKRLVMTGESTGPDGMPHKFKNVTEMKDKDHFTFKMFMVLPGMGEQLSFTIEYTRRK